MIRTKLVEINLILDLSLALESLGETPGEVSQSGGEAEGSPAA